MSTTTARDADRVPDGLAVHRVTTFRQASRVAADRAYGFPVFSRTAPGLARTVWPRMLAGADDRPRPPGPAESSPAGERPSR